MSALFSIQLREHLVISQFSFSSVLSAFHWAPSIGTLRMTPVPFVKSTESYECADWVIILVVQLRNGLKLVGPITTSDQTVRAMHSCTSWFCPITVSLYINIYIFTKMHTFRSRSFQKLPSFPHQISYSFYSKQ